MGFCGLGGNYELTADFTNDFLFQPKKWFSLPHQWITQFRSTLVIMFLSQKNQGLQAVSARK